PLFEYTGTIPVFRAKNYPDVPADTHVAAAERMIEVCSDRLGAGGVVLSFVEGTNSAPEDLRALRPESVSGASGRSSTAPCPRDGRWRCCRWVSPTRGGNGPGSRRGGRW